MGPDKAAQGALADDALRVENPVSEQANAEHYEGLAKMRRECPVAHGTRYGGFYALTRYEDVKAVFMDPATFSSASGVTLPNIAETKLPPIEYDPPLHTQYRRLLAAFLSIPRAHV